MWWIDAVLTGFEWGMVAVVGITLAMCLTWAWFEMREKWEVETGE